MTLKFITISKDSPSYPSRLLELKNPPPKIHIAGSLIEEDALSLAVVGSRKMIGYGKDVCEEIVSQVAQAGVTIVSGLVSGVDMAAHRAALKAGGRSIGILGFGADFAHKVPDKNVLCNMADSSGAIITEFNDNEEGAPWTFPKRDRIIAALASAVLVVEAAEKSGTMYTVSAARELKKEVMAIPGNIFSPVSKGTNQLIKGGARLVCGVSDILEVLDVSNKAKKIACRKNFPVSNEEKVVLEVLKNGDLYIDDVAVKTGISISVISAHLTSLELKGMVKNVGGGVYRKV